MVGFISNYSNNVLMYLDTSNPTFIPDLISHLSSMETSTIIFFLKNYIFSTESNGKKVIPTLVGLWFGEGSLRR